MIKNNTGVYQFESFLQFPTLIHGFSTRAFGTVTKDMVLQENTIEKFADALSVSPSDIVFMEQVHGKHIVIASKHDKGTFVPETDGLISYDKNVFLCVRTADCVPLFLFDPSKKIVAVSHVGWKGALENICAVSVDTMKEGGSEPDNIYAGIGPSIRSCCYDIDEMRMRLFFQQFPAYRDRIITKRSQKSYLDLQRLVALQLLEKGVREEHIEDSNLCTSDEKDEFFSYRKKNEVPFGLFGGIIGIT